MGYLYPFYRNTLLNTAVFRNAGRQLANNITVFSDKFVTDTSLACSNSQTFPQLVLDSPPPAPEVPMFLVLSRLPGHLADTETQLADNVRVESVPKITINDTINLFSFKLQSPFW